MIILRRHFPLTKPDPNTKGNEGPGKKVESNFGQLLHRKGLPLDERKIRALTKKTKITQNLSYFHTINTLFLIKLFFLFLIIESKNKI